MCHFRDILIGTVFTSQKRKGKILGCAGKGCFTFGMSGQFLLQKKKEWITIRTRRGRAFWDILNVSVRKFPCIPLCGVFAWGGGGRDLEHFCTWALRTPHYIACVRVEVRARVDCRRRSHIFWLSNSTHIATSKSTHVSAVAVGAYFGYRSPRIFRLSKPAHISSVNTRAHFGRRHQRIFRM